LDLVVSKLFPGYEDIIVGSIIKLNSDIIDSSDDKQHIKMWLEEVNKASKPELLYRASRDGWAKSAFHSKCDNKGATLTIAKTSEGYVFGGYIDVPWTSQNNGDWKSSEEAFLFSLRCHAGLAPTKLKLKPDRNKYAVYHRSDYGPTFGGWHDLCIGRCDRYTGPDLKKGSSVIGNTYELPDGASNKFLTGKGFYFKGMNAFKVSEVEVFRV